MKIFLERINFFKNNHEHFFVKTKINKINGKKKENLTKNTEEEKKWGKTYPEASQKHNQVICLYGSARIKMMWAPCTCTYSKLIPPFC